MGFFFDPLYWLFMGPAMVLAFWAQNRVQTAFREWSRVTASSGMTGAEAARTLLRQAGLTHVRVERVGGHLTDHYDPRDKAVRLSQPVYDNPSVAAVGVAAHEVGHAMQHADNYVWLGLRSAIVPVTQFGSSLAGPLILIGLVTNLTGLFDIGIIFFTLAVVFQLVTLPVEFNASRRALTALEAGGYGGGRDREGVRNVLTAAALTYFAALITALLQLLYLLALRGRRN